MHPAKVLLAALFALSATLIARPEDRSQVYVIDLSRAEKALEAKDETGRQASAAPGVTTFEPFTTTAREEELTTRHYRIPGTAFYITASVFYTDESMASPAKPPLDVNDCSLLVAVAVGKQRYPEAFTAFGAAVAETTYDQTPRKLRAKTRVRIGGKTYLVGIECELNGTPAG